MVEQLALAAFVDAPDAGGGVLFNYVPVLMTAVAVLGFAGAMIVVSWLFGQRKPSNEKLMPYECGKDPVGSARERHSVRFYLVAMIFLLFDIEAIFLIPWAVAFGNVLNSPAPGLTGNHSTMLFFYFEMMTFIGILFVGLIYVWKKGLFEWNR